MKPGADADEKAKKEIMKAMGTLIQGHSPDEIRVLLSQLSPSHPLIADNPLVRKALGAIITAYGELANSEARKSALAIPPNMTQLLHDFVTDRDWRVPSQTLLIDWRNQLIAKNVIQIYRANPEKDLYVLVGSNHVPGLKEELERQAGSSLPVAVTQSEAHSMRSEPQGFRPPSTQPEPAYRRYPDQPPSVEEKTTATFITMHHGGLRYVLQLGEPQPKMFIYNSSGSRVDDATLIKFFKQEIKKSAESDADLATRLKGVSLD